MGVTSSVQQFQRKREQRPLIKTSQKSVPFWQLWKLPIRKKEVDELGIEASDHPYGEDVPLFDLISSVCSSLCHDSQKHDHPSVGLIWKDSHAGGQYGLTGSVFHSGGVSHGPRGPTSYYNSSKEAQDDLHIVDSLDIPMPDSQYLLDLIRHRHWGESVLIVDVGEDFSENILQATANLKTVNIIPAIGLNVHSMLKHEEIVLTLETVKFLEDKLLWHDELYTPLYPFKLPYSDFP